MPTPTTRRRLAVATGLALAASFATGGARADAAAGRAKAEQVCAICHGFDGVSQLPNAPNLAGQPEIYLQEALDAYRTGRRQHEMMTVVAKDLTDADVANLAAWYASIGFTVTVPP
jgi:cytochrome c553